MAFNGSGVFNRLYNWANDAAANIKIRADRMDNEMNGFATGLSTCITKDGQTTITADLPMAGYVHTNVGAATARTQYTRLDQTQDGKINWVDGGGTADAITATYSPVITTLVDGQECYVRATAANATTTPTFSPNSLTARTIVKNGNVALAAGDIAGDGHELHLRYRLSDTKWELLNPAKTGAFTGIVSAVGAVNIAGTSSSAAVLTLAEDTDNGTNKITITAPAVLAADYTLTLPDDDGSASQYLQTNGSGVLSWATIGTATDSIAGLVEKATQAEMEAETADKYPDAALLKYHPGIAKCWVLYEQVGTTTILSSYGISGIVDDGTGVATITFTTSFSSATSYCAVGMAQRNTAPDAALVCPQGSASATPTAASIQLLSAIGSTGAYIDSPWVSVSFFGDL